MSQQIYVDFDKDGRQWWVDIHSICSFLSDETGSRTYINTPAGGDWVDEPVEAVLAKITAAVHQVSNRTEGTASLLVLDKKQ